MKEYLKDNNKTVEKSLYFESIGDDFDTWMSDYDVVQRKHLIKQTLGLDRIARPNSRVLEVGCGTGRISRAIHELGVDLTVNDISTKLTGQVASKLNCEALPGDCADLKSSVNPFDIIVSSECIEHATDPWRVMSGMKNLLKPGGILIVTTPNRLWWGFVKTMMVLKLRKFDGIENFVWPNEMRKWLVSNGFGEMSFAGCHLFPWQIPLAKKILPWLDQYGKILYPLMINFGFVAKKEK